MSTEKRNQLLDSIFALQHLVEDAHSPMPPEALGHELRGLTPMLQDVLDFAVERISHEEAEGER